jgi:hypothetical protein
MEGSTEKLLLKAKLLSISVLMTLIIRGILTWDPVWWLMPVQCMLVNDFVFMPAAFLLVP